MRYLGNKTKLVDFLLENVPALYRREGVKFYDMFSGTGTVGRHFKENGFDVQSIDILYFSYVLQRAYIATTGVPRFQHFAKSGNGDGYINALAHLDALPSVAGYVYKHFTAEGSNGGEVTRRYFSGANGQKMDAIRAEIERLYLAKDISKKEYFVLLATLLESVSKYANIAGVYGAFLKVDDPRSLKPFQMHPLDFSVRGKAGKAYHGDAAQTLSTIDVDVLYLDPPYNARQYAPNYHVLETIARNDNPVARGIAGIRNYDEMKSDFCNHDKALILLDKIARESQYKVLMMSYNSEGLMSADEILEVLGRYGTAKLVIKDYRRFRSNSGGEAATKPVIQEYLFVLERR
jgi:adenine-specific DNA-methyltransferase